MQGVGFDGIDDFQRVETPYEQCADAQSQAAQNGNEQYPERIDPQPGAERMSAGQVEADAVQEETIVSGAPITDAATDAMPTIISAA